MKLTLSDVMLKNNVEILTKRSSKRNNKENISSNGCKLKRIKEETTMRSKKLKNK